MRKVNKSFASLGQSLDIIAQHSNRLIAEISSQVRAAVHRNTDGARVLFNERRSLAMYYQNVHHSALLSPLQSHFQQALSSNIANYCFSLINNISINFLATEFFFQILAHSVFKMWVIQKPNKVALWNKRHFEEKKWRLYSMFKIFSTDICWINI